MNNSGWSHTESPFHPGELAVQARLGIQDRIDRQGRRIIRDYLTEQHQKFFAQLSYVIIGTVDQSGNPWASILVGEPGFLEVFGDLGSAEALRDRKLQVKTKLLTGDPLAVNLNEGIDIGLLGIELHTRRRNRINGIVTKTNADNFEIEVKQTFGNCPQYIQARTFEPVKSNLSSQINEITSFGECERNLITNADTFFIATAYQDEFASTNTNKGVDVSHKGGKPSFVRIDNNQTITIPDFSGNNHFNTIGNLELNPHAGLLFIDFAKSNLLYLTGTTEIIWSGTEVSSYQGAERLIRFHLTQGYQVKNSLPLSWSNPESSKFLDQTGSW